MGSTQDDKALALLAAKGDGDAFRQLLEVHYDLIFRVAYRFCGHREEAEDVAQDVCVALPRALKQFDGRSAFSTWLYRVVVNRAKDVKRREATAKRVASEYIEVEDLRQGEAQAAAHQAEWLHEMLDQLSDDQRQTAILVVGEGLSHAQAAELLEVKEGTISWRMSELKKSLKAMAKEEA